MTFAAALLYKSVWNEGLLGEVLKDYFSENVLEVRDRIIGSLRDALKADHLPANHDLRRAGLDSMRKTGLVLAEAVACQVDERLKKKSWASRVHRRLVVANWISAGSGPEMAWVQRLGDALKDEVKLKALDNSVVQIGVDSTKLLQATVDLALAAELQRKFAEWVEQQVDVVGKPPFFDGFLSDGWPVDQGTLTFFQAYCLFFREHLKHNPTVFNIFAGNTLTEIKNDLHSRPTGWVGFG